MPSSDTHTEPTAHPGYETSDANLRAILGLAIAVALLIVGSQIGLWYLLRSYETKATRNDPQLSPLAGREQAPPPPQLQSQPMADYQQFRDAQDKWLNSYGWVDKQQGIVHIPIDRAMQLVLQRGLPVPPPIDSESSNGQTEPNGDKPAENQGKQDQEAPLEIPEQDSDSSQTGELKDE